MITTILFGIMVLITAITVWATVHRVPDGDVHILVVLGDEREILHQGLYYIPPFVSSTYPVDHQTMQYDTPNGSVSIPPELREDLERTASADHQH